MAKFLKNQREISNKTEIEVKVTTQKSSTVVKKSSTVAASAKKKLKSKSSRKKVSASQNAGQKTSKLAIKSQKATLPSQTSSEEKHIETLEEKKIPEELEQNEIAETVSKKIIESADKTAIKENSSDATVSSDEAKYQSKIDSPRKRQKRVGKPLRYFTRIKENVLKANFSELQRLHILLFGASDKVKKSDKADNLKGNILAFGGFPFLEGSEEWKQKHFLLSLLAQNTLHEYLNLLCLEHDEDDQHSLVTKLMKFLAAPSEKLLGVDIKTKVVSSEPVNHVPVQATKEEEKKAKKGVEEKKKKHPRKILMDEATVKRLEADLAREQRILERERKLSEKQINKKTLDTKIGVNIPDKGPLTRLGELTNVKFLVVTANYNDLDVLHHLLYMTEANKTKVRKNILDFAGFNFDEDSFWL
ncbi:uncharacterized protein CEXT_437191 [Caerostris extrusa]|uniref:Uncharacterized protein n=1 Tax=Caerostris extrusa TaxID=172846 RepID=A0AAV4RQN2_CAEEX|nr:uncharacterized protein CEXT_437191 [Caerostris extrusa]